MTSSVFPDINVWVALTLRTHEHHTAAWRWYRELPEIADLVFCRFTQTGLLRLLTTFSVAGAHTMTQQQAWGAYDRWVIDGDCLLLDEPPGLETEFRAFADRSKPNPKEWADAYLAAFAMSASLELVTFDKALSQRTSRARLLR